MSAMQLLKRVVRRMIPAPLLNYLRQRLKTDLPRDALSYQGVYTQHNMRWLHEGRFAEIHDRYRTLNPFNSPNESRLRHYCVCMFAEFSRPVPGDFLSAGISFGVAPRVIYDFVEFERLGKTYHFIDPFLGINYPGDGPNPYNMDFEFVRRQYPPDAPIAFHRALLPDCFPLQDLTTQGLAFVHLNTTHPSAEAASLRYLYETLNPGGFIVIDSYSFGAAGFSFYDPVLKRIGAHVFSLVTGQGIIQKPLHLDSSRDGTGGEN
jgi:hypothetical protein